MVRAKENGLKIIQKADLDVPGLTVEINGAQLIILNQFNDKIFGFTCADLDCKKQLIEELLKDLAKSREFSLKLARERSKKAAATTQKEIENHFKELTSPNLSKGTSLRASRREKRAELSVRPKSNSISSNDSPLSGDVPPETVSPVDRRVSDADTRLVTQKASSPFANLFPKGKKSTDLSPKLRKGQDLSK